MVMYRVIRLGSGMAVCLVFVFLRLVKFPLLRPRIGGADLSSALILTEAKHNRSSSNGLVSSSSTSSLSSSTTTTSSSSSLSFLEAISSLTKELHDKPQITALRPWFGNSSSSTTSNYFLPGLSSQLLKDAFGGKRIVFLGDSTLYYMAGWLQTVLLLQTRMPSSSSSSSPAPAGGLETMTLRQANAVVNPLGVKLKQKGIPSQEAIKATISEWNGKPIVVGNTTTTIDGTTTTTTTTIEWQGHRGNSSKTKVCEFDDTLKDIQTRSKKPHIMVVNFGFHWFHLQGGGRNVALCQVQAWLHYEEWLEKIVQVALESSESTTTTKLLLFKTNNFICENRYSGQYATYVGKVQRERRQQKSGKKVDSDNNNSHMVTTAMTNARSIFYTCVQQLEELVASEYAATSRPPDLTRENIARYCTEGTFDEYGSQLFTQRMKVFVQQKQQSLLLQQQQQQQLQGSSTKQKKALKLAVFNDHDIQSCPYTGSFDGRHYHGLNLARIRLLANIIQELYE